jgi:hypothetical protein
MLSPNKQFFKPTFSGHESFQCRHLWLKKGYDFIKSGKSFNSEDAVVELGVGKNMVSSIRYWMKAFDIIDHNDELTIFAEKLLSDNGWDPYMEDEATLWLLHYNLVKKRLATSYFFIFNELRREKIEFTKENFISFVKRKAESTGAFQINEKTLAEDFGVMVKMYIRSDAQSKDKEDTFSGLLTELDLIKSYGKRGEEYYVIENTEKEELPDDVLLYAILDFERFDMSVSLSSIEQEPNSVGAVFAINRTGLVNKIESIIGKNKWITFTDHAGIKEIQFKKKPEALDILETYYAN